MKIGFIGLGKMGFNMVQRLLHYGHETVVWNIDPKLEKLEDYVEDSGEGRWTIQAAIDLDVPAPVITASLFSRFQSRQTESFAMKVLAALRNQFGGHAVKSKKNKTILQWIKNSVLLTLFLAHRATWPNGNSFQRCTHFM